MIAKIITWCFYLMMLDPSTQQGTLILKEYPTQKICKDAAKGMAEEMKWSKPPNCFSHTKVKGQDT